MTIVRRSGCCVSVFSSSLPPPSLPHLLPDHLQEQYNPPPFNYSDPALHYMTHSSPRVIDNVTARQRIR